MSNRSRKPGASRLRFESLEGRLLLSASPVVKVQHDTLYIRGTDGNDLVAVIASETSPGRFEVLAAFNGTTNLITYGPFSAKNLKIDLKNGDDSLTLGNLPSSVVLNDPGVPGNNGFTPEMSIRGELYVDTGRGADNVSIGGISVGKNARIKTGDGADAVDIALSQFSRNLDVETGRGNDIAMLSGNFVRGEAEVETHDGLDFVGIVGLRVGKDLEVETGRHDDQVFAVLGATDLTAARDALEDFLTTGSGAGQFNALLDLAGGVDALLDELGDVITYVAPKVQASVIAREAEFDTGDGVDNVTLANLNISKELEVEMGRGNDILRLASSTAREVEVETGDNDDTATLANLNISKELEVEMGRGENDVLNFSNNVYGKASLDGGHGRNDRLNLSGTNGATRRKTKISHFESVTGTLTPGP